MSNEKLNWNDLRYFLEVARKGRLLGASKALGVNHTTVSRRINALERALQVKLLEQDEHGFHLTPIGESILPIAQQIEDATELTKERVNLSSQSLSGTLRVGAPDGFGNSFLAPQISEFTHQNPDIKIQLVPVPLTHNLLKREVDLAITLEPTERKDLLCRKITDYQLFLYTSKRYVEQNDIDLTDIEAIKTHPFASYISDILYSEQLDFNGEIGRDLNNPFQGATVMSQLEFVAEGGGFGVLPHFMAEGDDRFIRVLPQQYAFTRSYWLLIPIELNRLSSVRALTDAIFSIVRKNKLHFCPE